MKRNILLVEDEEILRMIYREELEEGGYKVQAVSNGQEALDSFRHGKFGLVVMDILMPVMDGLETLSFLKREYGKVPVILIPRRTNIWRIPGSCSRMQSSGKDPIWKS
jgi:CheY-like chemotaxis protein